MADRAKQRNDELEDRTIGAPSVQNISTNPSLEPRVPRIAIVGAARSEAILRLKSWASTLACSMIRPIRSPFIRPPPVRLQERICWQALYQACPPPSSAQEELARGRS
jgi:hypothetical protein